MIKEVYWDFFANLLKKTEGIDADFQEITNAVISMADMNDVVPITKIVENILKQLSNRDYIKFDEKYIKLLLVVLISLTKSYFIKSEPETNKKYPDLLFLRTNRFRPKYEHLFEIKYIKKENAAKLDEVRTAGIEQVKGYLATEDIKAISSLRAWLIIFTGDVCSECLEITV